MMDHKLVTKLKEEAGNFSGSIWGNSPPLKKSTTSEVVPETPITLKLTAADISFIVTALDVYESEYGQGNSSKTHNLIATLEQALVNGR